MLTPRGIYKDGVVTFIDEPPSKKEFQVLITFLDSELELTILQKEKRDLIVNQIRESGLGLTERELSILRLARDGMSTNDIANYLKINQGTVRNHLSNLYNTLHVRNRLSAIKRAVELGLLEQVDGL